MAKMRPSNFYYEVTGLEAERLLLEQGTEGSFLARPSAQSGHFTLSVRRNGKVTHVKIQRTGDYFDLHGGERFQTLAELVQHYMEKPELLREANGDFIALKFPLIVDAACSVSNELAKGPWFHGAISKGDAERLLNEQGKSGTFLVREAQTKPGSCAISVRTADDRITHVLINKSSSWWDLGGGDRFATFHDLLEHYGRNPMVDTTGEVVYLKTPLCATRAPAATLADRVQHMLQLQSQAERVDSAGAGGVQAGTSASCFSDEFFRLQKQDSMSEHVYSRRHGSRDENKCKNRFSNILPYDHTRVVLRDSDPAVPGSDYINANKLEVLDDYAEFNGLKKSYIATQGCLKNTEDDFWRMVWQENSRIIVCLTKEVERGLTKCTQYWPSSLSDTRRYGLRKELCVRLAAERVEPDYCVRTLEMTLCPVEEKNSKGATKNARDGENAARVIFHWQFVAWPDHGCPIDPGSLLNFLNEVNGCAGDMCIADAGPLVVHCSAGIGRTGTIIVIDLIISQIKRIGLHCMVDVGRTVQMLREQRAGMVQTEHQYHFIYQALAHFVHNARRRLNLSETDCVGGMPKIRSQSREYTNVNEAGRLLTQASLL